ncbi:MAG: NAD-dependent deacylase [Gammaproteobacteria bacterium]|nr:NAD-dependent deacylase [Gammaproteobacteria bacterium]
MTTSCDIPGALISALRDARHVYILTGAGVSAESGVPTFRDAQEGLWAQYDPLQLATPEAFLADPELVWRWYRWRRELVAKAEPNPGHYAITQLAEQVPSVTLITQNVDGLHQQAGSSDVIEFHGNLFVDRCFVEGTLQANAGEQEAVPKCQDCGGHLRPGVVWFGESIPTAALDAATAAIGNCDVFMSIGTSSVVWPAAGFAAGAANQGATVIEVNLEETPLSSTTHIRLQGKSGEILPELIDCV